MEGGCEQVSGVATSRTLQIWLLHLKTVQHWKRCNEGGQTGWVEREGVQGLAFLSVGGEGEAGLKGAVVPGAELGSSGLSRADPGCLPSPLTRLAPPAEGVGAATAGLLPPQAWSLWELASISRGPLRALLAVLRGLRWGPGLGGRVLAVVWVGSLRCSSGSKAWGGQALARVPGGSCMHVCPGAHLRKLHLQPSFHCTTAKK